MSKYFKDGEDIKLSDYYGTLKSNIEEAREKLIVNEELETVNSILSEDLVSLNNLEKALSIMGDVKMTKTGFYIFNRYLNSETKYDVKYQKDNLEGICKLIREFPMLTEEAILEIAYQYKKDIFEKRFLLHNLMATIDKYGNNDVAFEEFMKRVKATTEQYDSMYAKEIEKLIVYKNIYSKNYIKFLENIMRSRHLSFEEVSNYLPASEMIEKDENVVENIYKEYGIKELPISYELTATLIEHGDIDRPEEFLYYGKGNYVIDVPFTVEEFISSVTLNRTKEKTISI
ncbi:MAG: hypothetical protein IJ565_00855 [Bacilli bacterium]|nr:hypothetical protein [Bacilli bacterium]